MNPQLKNSIKVISPIAMTGALGLEGWNLYLNFQGKSLPTSLNSLFWLGTVALIAHVALGLIAASKASSHDKNPLTYSIYTFFVGFVGLQELSRDRAS